MPFIADLKPSGKYVMEDVQKIGGTPAVMKYLLEKGLIDGSCMVRPEARLALRCIDRIGMVVVSFHLVPAFLHDSPPRTLTPFVSLCE